NEHIFKEVKKEWRDYLEPENKIDGEKFDTKSYINDLLNCYKEWKEEGTNKKFQGSYQIATELLKEYEIPPLNEDEINELIEKVEEKEDWSKGLFLSAMINKLYKKEEIYLPLGNINFIGSFNKDKKIVVKGDCDNYTGYCMEGGEIVIEGNCGNWTGYDMKGGKIRIYGDNFDPKSQISEHAEGGKIYHKGIVIYKDNTYMGEKKWKRK
ncbi:MAG: hypothetical protein KAU95_00900, partial [Candidatus Aenigmarchaeota archaeon]|nr:hypothetical protein [Candidatus Aenigmarchaeota archaeon]